MSSVRVELLTHLHCSEEACEVQVPWSKSSSPSSPGFHICVTCRSNYSRPRGGRSVLTAEDKKASVIGCLPRCHGRFDVTELTWLRPGSSTLQPEGDREYQRWVNGLLKHTGWSDRWWERGNSASVTELCYIRCPSVIQFYKKNGDEQTFHDHLERKLCWLSQAECEIERKTVLLHNSKDLLIKVSRGLP